MLIISDDVFWACVTVIPRVIAGGSKLLGPRRVWLKWSALTHH